MAIISVLLSFIGKKIGSIVQAIFGWSVTALFGRLPPKKQLAVSIALLLSIAWPIFVVGLFFPSVAGWVLAFVPLEKWLGPVALRIIWGALAFVAPMLVGLLVQWAAPAKKGGIGRALLNGYPLALGLFCAFILTVVTVPIIKITSLVRGWTDTHVYLQPRVGSYDKVVRELTEACARAGVLPEITEVPTTMALSTKVLRTLARGMVSPIVAEQVKRVRADGLELYLYPSDLLIRGKAERVSLVRAMLTRTDVDKDAYLVGSEKAQCIQDELGRLIEVVASHERMHAHVGGTAGRRLVEIWNEMNESKLPFDEWVMLESIARRVERRIVREHVGDEAMILDAEDDELDKIAAKANAPEAEQRSTVVKKEEEIAPMSLEPIPSSVTPGTLEEASTVDLVKEALDEAKELVRLEVELAKEEVREEVKQVRNASIAFAVAAAAGLLVLCLLGVALVLALGGTALAALGVAGGFLVLGAAAGWTAYGMLPKKPLEKTRNRLQADVNQLKEHIA